MQICLNPGEKLYPEFLQVIKFQGKLLKGQIIFIANNTGDCKGCVKSEQFPGLEFPVLACSSSDSSL